VHVQAVHDSSKLAVQLYTACLSLAHLGWMDAEVNLNLNELVWRQGTQGAQIFDRHNYKVVAGRALSGQFLTYSVSCSWTSSEEPVWLSIPKLWNPSNVLPPAFEGILNDF